MELTLSRLASMFVAPCLYFTFFLVGMSLGLTVTKENRYFVFLYFIIGILLAIAVAASRYIPSLPLNLSIWNL